MKLMTDDIDKFENILAEYRTSIRERAFYASEIVLSHSKTPSHIVFEVRNARGIPVSQLTW